MVYHAQGMSQYALICLVLFTGCNWFMIWAYTTNSAIFIVVDGLQGYFQAGSVQKLNISH